MRAWKWAAALAVSLAVHAGAAVYVMERTPDIEIAGGGVTEIALAGNAFADMVSAGDAVDEAEPLTETATETVQPETVAEIVTETTVEATSAATVESVGEESPVEAEEPVEQAPEAETAEEIVEPVENAQVVAALAEVPVPTPRPAYTPPPKPKVERRQKVAKAAPPKKRQAGSRGKDQQDARRGTASGRENARKATEGRKTARATQSGNAQVSNYPGKVRTKLRRAQRYPSAAKRQRLKGEAHVRFTIARNGSVSAIRIVRSSGSDILDQAAVDTVRRAAPFPRIPDGAGRSSWGFTVPLAFRR
ncbi:TonB family protein [Nitratireductor aquimarinus]|uniref:Protein TonB n=1 Tax=Nitratireductor aquimarinus TaxID=889300 RepID=A0ABU4AK86_9HYPH|nr:TonB family protein [Nitratireductor aquimarinus]MDV6226648.1 TonB family protein [Nitratireductor aquimarinus]